MSVKTKKKNRAAVAMAKLRAKKLSKRRRREIAIVAARARWSKHSRFVSEQNLISGTAKTE